MTSQLTIGPAAPTQGAPASQDAQTGCVMESETFTLEDQLAVHVDAVLLRAQPGEKELALVFNDDFVFLLVADRKFVALDQA